MKSPSSFHLTIDERCTLEVWASAAEFESKPARTTSKRALRASIVLAAAAGQDTHAIALHLNIRPSTANKWRRRFIQERLAGLDDRPRSGAPRRISDERIADVVLRTLEPTPQEARPWSRRTMSHATGLSRSSIHRIWNAFDIAPDRPTPRNDCSHSSHDIPLHPPHLPAPP